MVQLRKALDRELLWKVGIYVLILSVVAKYLIENIVRDGGLVLQENLEGLFHSIK